MTPRLFLRHHQAYAFRVGRRYFCGWTRSGVVKTAWHVAGAELFQSLHGAETAVEVRGSRRMPRGGFELIMVQVSGPVEVVK
jgi:hypothetical protein